MPGFIKPQLATLKSRAPKGEQWLHEIKYDGYRVQVHLNRGRKKVFTRNGLDWTKRFTEIVGALAIQGEAMIDGEVVVVHEGRTNFSEAWLQVGKAASSTTPSTSSGGMRPPQAAADRAQATPLRFTRRERHRTPSAVFRASHRQWAEDV
jgi:hypothetical protein